MAFEPRFLRAVAASLACALPLIAASCSEEVIDPLPEEIDSYVGEIAGSDAVFALTAADRELVLYVCGGPSSFDRHSRWYRGERADSGASVLEAADGSSAQLRFVVDASGTERIEGEVVETDGTELPLVAPLSAPGTVAGLYGAIDAGCRTGVVVQQGSAADDPVVQGTWCSDEGIFAQVTPITPLEDGAPGFLESGFEVQIEIPSEPGNRRGERKQLLVRSINPADF